MGKSEISIKLGQRIKSIRKSKKMTQEEAALEVDMHPAYYGCIERGEKCPTLDTLFKIAKALDVKPSYLIDFDTDDYFYQNDERIELLYDIIDVFNRLSLKELQEISAILGQLSSILKLNE